MINIAIPKTMAMADAATPVIAFPPFHNLFYFGPLCTSLQTHSMVGHDALSGDRAGLVAL